MIDLKVDRCCRTCGQWAVRNRIAKEGICLFDGESTEATTYCYAWEPIAPVAEGARAETTNGQAKGS